MMTQLVAMTIMITGTMTAMETIQNHSPITSDNDSSNNDNNQDQSPSSSSECQGQADCFTGIVTELVDGDTFDVNNVRVRLSLVNTPEREIADTARQKGIQNLHALLVQKP